MKIVVKQEYGTYRARCQGKTASATSGAISAAMRVAEKVVDGEKWEWHIRVGMGGMVRDAAGRQLYELVVTGRRDDMEKRRIIEC